LQTSHQTIRISIFAAVFAMLFVVGAGLFAFAVAPMPMSPEQAMLVEGFAEDCAESNEVNAAAISSVMTRVTNVRQWEQETKNRQTVLFVQCDFNVYPTVPERDVYAAWHAEEYGRNPLLINTTPNHEWSPEEIEQELFDLLQEIWREHNLPVGGYKSWGGASLTVWFDDGDFVGYRKYVGSLEDMQSRTKAAFGS